MYDIDLGVSILVLNLREDGVIHLVSRRVDPSTHSQDYEFWLRDDSGIYFPTPSFNHTTELYDGFVVRKLDGFGNPIWSNTYSTNETLLTGIYRYFLAMETYL